MPPFRPKIVLIYFRHAHGHVLLLKDLQTTPEEKTNTALVMWFQYFGVFFSPFCKINDLNHMGEGEGKNNSLFLMALLIET